MKIEAYTYNDKQDWDEYVLNHPQGLAYHLTAWKDSVEQAYGFKSLYLIARNGTTIKGVLPLTQHHLPFLKGKLISLPFCDAAGPLANSWQTEKALVDEAVKLARLKGIKKISIRASKPYAGLEESQVLNKSKVGMVLNLPESSGSLLASFKAKLRSQIKKPIRDGLTVETGSKNLVKDFYPLFAENMHSLGSPVHSMKWIESILLNYKNRAHLFVVRMPDKSPAAGGILLCHPNRVSVPWASSRKKFNRWNPNMLLYWSFLKFSCDMHFPTFDFGRSTPGEGTFRFKKQWGAEPKDLFWDTFSMLENKWMKVNDSLKDRLPVAESIWRRLPLNASVLMGTIIRKYIDL